MFKQYLSFKNTISLLNTVITQINLAWKLIYQCASQTAIATKIVGVMKTNVNAKKAGQHGTTRSIVYINKDQNLLLLLYHSFLAVLVLIGLFYHEKIIYIY
jgi:hypothetical protein